MSLQNLPIPVSRMKLVTIIPNACRMIKHANKEFLKIVIEPGLQNSCNKEFIQLFFHLFMAFKKKKKEGARNGHNLLTEKKKGGGGGEEQCWRKNISTFIISKDKLKKWHYLVFLSLYHKGHLQLEGMHIMILKSRKQDCSSQEGWCAFYRKISLMSLASYISCNYLDFRSTTSLLVTDRGHAVHPVSPVMTWSLFLTLTVPR